MNTGPTLSILRDRLAAWLGFTHEGARDLYQQFGWFRTLQKQHLYAMYQRNAIANRIIRLYPQATWREKPIIRDEKGSSPEEGKPDYSPFAAGVDELFEVHRVYHFLERGDRVSSLGALGAILCGFQDGLDPIEPLGRGKFPLLYLAPYSDLNITVARIDDNPRSPRFGLPMTYTLQTGGAIGTGHTSNRRSITAHWSRVIHLSEYLDEDNVYGIPRLFPVFNYLQDLDKVLGSSTETFWLNARAGLSLEADKDAQVDATMLAAARAQAEEYEHQLRRIMAFQGMKANMLNAEVSDPSMTVGGLLDVISGGSGIPKRILIGSERGELASSQDENNWAQRIDERRQSFAVPAVLTPLVNMLIFTGNLPMPQGQWWVEWGGKAMTPEQQASVGASMANTLKNYLTSPGSDVIVPPTEFRTKFLGLQPMPDQSDDPFDDVLAEAREAAAAEAKELAEAEAGAKAAGKEDDKDEDNLKTNTKVAPLYVCRKVVNAVDILEWAEAQGFKTLIPEDELHVTIIYSRAAVDWLKMGADETTGDDGTISVRPGGPRLVEKFNDKAVVLSFANSHLAWRHEELRRCGASHDYEYCPHITLTYDSGNLDISKMTPYRGEIVLGPEEFKDISPSWRLAANEWDESKHPRAEDGKWTDGGGGGNNWEGNAAAVVKAGKGTIRYTDKSGNILGAVQHTGGPNQPWWATDHEADPISKHKTAQEAKAAVEAFVRKRAGK